ncbi:transglutaminase-like domain-containing protein [Streptomyces litchfieldiae]|uniref:Transglutaminase domain-containing protein n=1 Tax=Streptomyces litchfieldiae TaxID=3075543 RepID=A0ABU2MZZ5_9ACTN|nr:transglutaminase domain-containing protein [Streptomyces sp. DSM 44938]MDT0346403.1 transglutaminase domain-containing protein [Streptomyces sp. DSM 44938]
MSAQLPVDVAEFYRTQSTVTDPGEAGRAFLGGLPSDPGALARVVRGLIIHRLEADRFDYRPPEERLHHDAETRYVDDMLRIIRERRDAPLTERREPDERLVGTCRDFVVLHVALLREAGIPARARAGTCTYFSPHHWVTEYWDTARGWTLVDPELTFAAGEETHGFPFDPYDVPRSDFLPGGTGWRRARGHDAEQPDSPNWPVLVSDVLLDLATLNKVEMLPWDSWGASDLLENGEPAAGELRLLDSVAAVTGLPGPPLAELRRIFTSDDRLRVPAAVTSYTTHLGVRKVTLRR